MIKGAGEFFNTTKGFGFIQPNDGSKDAFVHISRRSKRSASSTLNEGQKVSYELRRAVTARSRRPTSRWSSPRRSRTPGLLGALSATAFGPRRVSPDRRAEVNRSAIDL